MATFCVVAPIQVMEELRRQTGHNQYLILAHDVVKHPDRYRKFFRAVRTESTGYIIILDNSVVELGTSVDVEMIAEAYAITLPTAVALPDVMLDGPATVESAHKSFKPLHEAILKKGSLHPKFMVIPQGKTINEFYSCAEKLRSLPYVSWWGCPRNLVAHLGTRQQAVKILKALNDSRSIHLFGFSDNMVDDFLCAHMKEVTSIDSAVPLRATNFDLTVPPPPRSKTDWWENGTCTQDTINNYHKALELFA